MSLEKALELNTAAVSRLADLMERFKPNAATGETEAPKADKPAPKKKAPAKKVKEVEFVEGIADIQDAVIEVKEKTVAEVKTIVVPKEIEEEMEKILEEVKEVELVDIQKVARVLITAGGDAKTQAKEAIEKVAGAGAKIATLDKALYADVLAALEAVQANLEEV